MLKWIFYWIDFRGYVIFKCGRIEIKGLDIEFIRICINMYK